jgi:hypothetical protein
VQSFWRTSLVSKGINALDVGEYRKDHLKRKMAV